MSASASIILASGSNYRRQQLANLGLEVAAIAADIDETRAPGENPAAMASRLARSKALAIAQRHPHAIVIGADQVAADGDTVYGKPGNSEQQRRQLSACAGRCVHFYTALCLWRWHDDHRIEHLDLTRCTLRDLDESAIDRYVAAEPAWDCAGGFKIEGRGISLFVSVQTSDPSALIGLPLIALVRLLRQFDVFLP
jgi:septum formation protein